jgi:hypothetical protein
VRTGSVCLRFLSKRAGRANVISAALSFFSSLAATTPEAFLSVSTIAGFSDLSAGGKGRLCVGKGSEMVSYAERYIEFFRRSMVHSTKESSTWGLTLHQE